VGFGKEGEFLEATGEGQGYKLSRGAQRAALESSSFFHDNASVYQSEASEVRLIRWRGVKEVWEPGWAIRKLSIKDGLRKP